MLLPLLSLMLSGSYLNDLDQPSSRLLDQEFGLGLRPEQLFLSRYDYPALKNHGLFDIYYRPWAKLRQESGGGGISNINLDKDSFKVNLDVQQFKPEEIEVTVEERYIIVSGKHEEKKDEHGLVSRQFVRKYSIPEKVDAEQISSKISSDGILTIHAPLKKLEEDKNVRKIKIEYTGKPALKHNQEEKKEESTTTSSTTEESTTQK